MELLVFGTQTQSQFLSLGLKRICLLKPTLTRLSIMLSTVLTVSSLPFSFCRATHNFMEILEILILSALRTCLIRLGCPASGWSSHLLQFQIAGTTAASKAKQTSYKTLMNFFTLSVVTQMRMGSLLSLVSLKIPQNLPCSVTLQPGPEDTGKACGVDYEIRAFCARSVEEKIHKRNSVRLVIRKVQYAPEKPGPQPMVETTRSFLMSDRSLHLEASLDKELYYHGEPISVNVHVTNNSTKTVKRVKISVRQYADICLFSTAQYKCPVAQLEADDQVSSSSTFCKVYTLTPTLNNNREKRGLALDGKLKHEDTNLASSTIVKDGCNKEVLGVLVSYRVKVKLVVSRGGDVSVELPFVLMHPKPIDVPTSRPASAVPEADPPIDTNLIEFDTNFTQDDDLVFEDFARLRLKGTTDDKDEDC
ncbi:arrestin, beta 2a isoform X2 [Ictalurus punctatus]|uniref:Arrestin, beta 2a isoform X2 n=1 Tax=Ictalurus punctatus TaxID=7998 RepID=A0A9F7RCU1_ICTPU|nr:arrestin, beta 2a isoform X2 [Ictalurus punctatus]